MTRLTGHWVSRRIAAELDGLTRGVVEPPVHENSTPPATAIAERSRKRRRLIGRGCGSSVIASERTGGSWRIRDGAGSRGMGCYARSPPLAKVAAGQPLCVPPSIATAAVL